jgi:hypothetical protein
VRYVQQVCEEELGAIAHDFVKQLWQRLVHLGSSYSR